MKDYRSEIDSIRHDLNALKANGSALARDLRRDSGTAVRDRVSRLSSGGRRSLHRVEDRIREKPVQTLALGLVAGVILSYVMGRRR